MPETYVHVQDKNREISPLGREEGYGGKDLEKRWVLRREWKTQWDTPTTDLGAELEPGNGESTLRWPTDKEREEKEEVCEFVEVCAQKQKQKQTLRHTTPKDQHRRSRNRSCHTATTTNLTHTLRKTPHDVSLQSSRLKPDEPTSLGRNVTEAWQHAAGKSHDKWIATSVTQ